MALFEYPVSRPVTIPGFTYFALIAGTIYIVLVVLINVVVVGYDTVNYSSTDFNTTHGLWYDVLVPGRNRPYSHRTCEPAILKLNDCISSADHFDDT